MLIPVEIGGRSSQLNTLGVVMVKVNHKMKSIRLRAGLSQNKLARKADLDRSTISSAENGGDVQEITVTKIATALGVAVDEITEV